MTNGYYFDYDLIWILLVICALMNSDLLLLYQILPPTVNQLNAEIESYLTSESILSGNTPPWDRKKIVPKWNITKLNLEYGINQTQMQNICNSTFWNTWYV